MVYVPRVISEDLYKKILRDYKTLLDNTTLKAACDTLQDRIKKLELAPEWRKGQSYTD